jgi:hypothetical protein
MINTMNKQILIVSAVLVVFAVSVTATAQVVSTSTLSAEVATTTEETTTAPVAEPVIADQSASTTESAPITETSPVEETESAPVTEEVPMTIEAVATATTTEAVSSLEETYFQHHGRYLQVLKNNQLPGYEYGTAAEKLGGEIPASWYIHVYQAEEGFGYQIFYSDEETMYSVGFGPEAESRTYSNPLPTPSTATSTDAF